MAAAGGWYDSSYGNDAGPSMRWDLTPDGYPSIQVWSIEDADAAALAYADEDPRASDPSWRSYPEYGPQGYKVVGPTPMRYVAVVLTSDEDENTGRYTIYDGPDKAAMNRIVEQAQASLTAAPHDAQSIAARLSGAERLAAWLRAAAADPLDVGRQLRRADLSEGQATHPGLLVRPMFELHPQLMPGMVVPKDMVFEIEGYHFPQADGVYLGRQLPVGKGPRFQQMRIRLVPIGAGPNAGMVVLTPYEAMNGLDVAPRDTPGGPEDDEAMYFRHTPSVEEEVARRQRMTPTPQRAVPARRPPPPPAPSMMDEPSGLTNVDIPGLTETQISDRTRADRPRAP